MKRNIIILIFVSFIFFIASDASHATNKKSILILLDELDMDNVEQIFPNQKYGIGFINLKTGKPASREALYFSVGMGRKVGLTSEYYRGLYRDTNGRINIIGFQDMIREVKKSSHVSIDLLGSRLANRGVSYIGNDSSAIIAADHKGRIEFGEMEILYDKKWLTENTHKYLSKSQLLLLSYNINQKKGRIDLLRRYIDNLKDVNIIIVPESVSHSMKHLLNKSLVPVVYIDGENEGIVQSISTKREGFISLGDICVELLANGGEKSPSAIGNRINIVDKKDNITYAKDLYKKTINLMMVVYLFHGMVCMAQIYAAYHIYKNKDFDRINFYNNYIIINICISILMGISNWHINIALYLFINILVSYIITLFIEGRAADPIGLFATLIYGLIIYSMLLKPEILYNSPIGFNNLFYGFRYYGLNNGAMGILLGSSILSYSFIRQLASSNFSKGVICFLYFLLNIIVLSGNYGANTGGFIAATFLFLIMIYVHILDKNFSVASIFALTLVGLVIFMLNMHFDYFSNEKSHAINFFLRIRDLGIGELINMYKIKAKELVKLSILPPFSIAIITQIYSFKKLSSIEALPFQRETNIMLIMAVVTFILNDTGMIAFIYIMHYILSVLIYYNLHPISKA